MKHALKLFKTEALAQKYIEEKGIVGKAEIKAKLFKDFDRHSTWTYNLYMVLVSVETYNEITYA